MDSNSDDFNIEEDGLEFELPSNDSIYTDPENLSSGNSNIFLQSSSSSSSSSDFTSEEVYTKKLNDNVRDLKTELQTRCHLDWLTKFEPSEHSPKIELNLLLHGAIRERTLRELALSKSIDFRNDEQIITGIFLNDSCLLKRIFQEIINDQREQRIIYTEILFRPDVFNFENKVSNTKLKDIIKILIDCIRFFTTTEIEDKKPIYIKIILSCNWNNIQSMSQFIRFARDYPDEIIGIDFYGQEDDCRKYWHDFYQYTKILHHYHIRYQASMNNYKDLQLIDDVIQGLNIDRLCEAYEIVLSTEKIENILIKHGIHLVICPISNAYTIANHQINDSLSETVVKEKHQLTSLLDNLNNEKDSSGTGLMNLLQSELINYSITSLSPIAYQQNLSSIYKNLFQNNQNSFTCEHMQWLNENALKASFASQKLKTELINYLHENYANCYKPSARNAN